MRILLFVHSFNSLAQRVYVDLVGAGHHVSVEFDIHESVTAEALQLFRPDLVVSPYLKRAIPEAVYSRHVCLVVHPGVVGDRGPAALDWAILEDEKVWGVTVLQANAIMDGGDIWATGEFPMRPASKSSLYRREVATAGSRALLSAVDRFAQGAFRPTPLADWPAARGGAKPAVGLETRRIDWERDTTDLVLRKIRSGDSSPGAVATVDGKELRLFGVAVDEAASGTPGALVGRSGGCACIATRDAAVWVSHAMTRGRGGARSPLKLPIASLLGDEFGRLRSCEPTTREPVAGTIRYDESGAVGSLSFEFMNGAMGVAECEALSTAIARAKARDVRVLVLWGGGDFWSNGIDLKQIEAASQPAEESWRNIVAMNSLVREIVESHSHLVLVAMRGGAGAGGVFLALAADFIYARRGILLNAHYRNMGNLYGSEYWTYLLPRRVGKERAAELARLRLPLGAEEAAHLGLIDGTFDEDADAFVRALLARAHELAEERTFRACIDAKVRRREADERERPLDSYASAELERMKISFFGLDPSYHLARYNFVHRVPHSRTPLYLATHRDGRAATGAGTLRHA